MPRTKRPVKKTEKASESGEASEFLKKLSKTGVLKTLFHFPLKSQAYSNQV